LQQPKIFDAYEKKAEGELTMAIADFIHSCGLPFSLASHHKFKRVLELAKNAPKKYKPPGRNLVAGELLDMNYQLYKDKMMEKLQVDADIYGLSFFGDGATVKKSPLINILASSVELPVGCLQIVDCTGHLESDGRKNAAFISELFLPHIMQMEDKIPKCTDLVIFDGASNVQKAGLLLEAKFPHISVIHGAEHVISLFYHDVFCIREFELLKRMNRLIYRYFGSGSMHSPYALFSKHSKDHNGGKCIGLIRAADTRMAGHVISILRTLRLKDALTSTITSASFIQGKFKVSHNKKATLMKSRRSCSHPTSTTADVQVEKKLIDVLKRDSTWEIMAKFIRAVFPMLIVLRLADQKDPVMDKLLFYVRRMDRCLEKSKETLDELEEKTKGVSWRVLNDLDDTDAHSDNSESDDDHTEVDDSSDNTIDDTEGIQSTKTLGQKVIDIWQKRRPKLVSDFAIAGWLLSPIPEIFADSKANMDGAHKAAVDRLLKKMYAAELADDSDELARIMNTFWDEFEDFKSKKGVFGTAYIWNANNTDLVEGKSHSWHKKHSFCSTKILGKFACRVCSKIVGIGSAERNWSDVKHLKSAKRSHLSPEAVEKQATIYGASCMEDAGFQRQKARENELEPFKFWDDKDFDKQFDIFAGVDNTRPVKVRVLKCYFEDWEKEHVQKKDDVSMAKLLNKYGGLEFDDLDHLQNHYVIDSTDMVYRRNAGWCVKAFKQGDDDFTPWYIDADEALHECLAVYYTKHTEKNVKIVIRKNQEDVIADRLTTIENVEHQKTKKRKAPSPKKTKNPREAESFYDGKLPERWYECMWRLWQQCGTSSQM